MTYRDSRVAVVVPAYNEEAFIDDVITGLPAFVDRVYPVDDCSTDATWDVIRTAAARENERRSATDPYDHVVEPLHHDENRGAGAAVITGYEAALADGVDVVARMDGDGQMDPAFLPALLDPVVDQEVAYAKGNRLAGAAYVKEMSRWRLFGNTLLTGLTRVSSGYWQLRDPQNGYTVASGDALESLDFDCLYEQYGFLNDLLVQLSVEGFRVADVSHPATYGDETSGIRYLSFVPNLSWLLLRRFWWRLGRQASRDGPPVILTAFAGGSAGLFAALARRTPFCSSSPPRHDESLPTHPHGRTDGGVDTTDDTTPLLLLGALFLLCLGTLLDIRRRRGTVLTVNGTPHETDDAEARTPQRD